MDCVEGFPDSSYELNDIMLFVLFQLGHDRYALDAMQVAEILPLLCIKQSPLAPAGVAGAVNYRNAPLPVIDLSELALGRPAVRRQSTRIILVHYPDRDGTPQLLGLIAEKATETMRCEPSDFRSSGITNEGAPYLGPIVSDASGLIQWIEVDKLLPPSVRDVLFK
jgi:chemotaxis-related protein WspB